MDSIQTPTEAAAEWQASNPEAAAVLRAEGAESERDRIAAVRAQSMRGHEALIERLAADGKTTGPEAAVAVVAAEKTLQATQAAVRQVEAPPAVPFAPAPEALEAEPQAAKSEPTGKEMAELAIELQAKARAEGRTLSATDAVARARRELIKN